MATGLLRLPQLIVAASLLAGAGRAPLTLDQALAQARQANAQLPVAALDQGIAEQRRREAEAQRRVVVSAEGELWLAPTGGYDPTVTDSGDERLQVIAEKTIYDGGALAARQRQARVEVGLARARYRQAVADVDLEVPRGLCRRARRPARSGGARGRDSSGCATT